MIWPRPALASAIPVMYASLWASETPSAVVGLITLGAVLLSFPKVPARIGGVLVFLFVLAIILGLWTSAFREWWIYLYFGLLALAIWLVVLLVHRTAWKRRTGASA